MIRLRNYSTVNMLFKLPGLGRSNYGIVKTVVNDHTLELSPSLGSN